MTFKKGQKNVSFNVCYNAVQLYFLAFISFASGSLGETGPQFSKFVGLLFYTHRRRCWLHAVQLVLQLSPNYHQKNSAALLLIENEENKNCIMALRTQGQSFLIYSNSKELYSCVTQAVVHSSVDPIRQKKNIQVCFKDEEIPAILSNSKSDQRNIQLNMSRNLWPYVLKTFE